MLSLLPQLTDHLPHWQEVCEPILCLPLCNHPIYLGPCHTQWGAQGTCQPGLSWLYCAQKVPPDSTSQRLTKLRHSFMIVPWGVFSSS